MIFTRGNVTIITQEKEGHKDPVPEVGKVYYAYDDGKVRPSREYTVTIDELIQEEDESKLPEVLYNAWCDSANECYWLYNPETDYIVRGHINNEDQDICYFVRTHGGHWHSIDYPDAWMGSNLALDVTGENRAYVVANWGEEA